jgi:hypothetical protein
MQRPFEREGRFALCAPQPDGRVTTKSGAYRSASCRGTITFAGDQPDACEQSAPSFRTASRTTDKLDPSPYKLSNAWSLPADDHDPRAMDQREAGRIFFSIVHPLH